MVLRGSCLIYDAQCDVFILHVQNFMVGCYLEFILNMLQKPFLVMNCLFGCLWMHFGMSICFDLSLTPYEVDAASHLAMPVIVTAITWSITRQHHRFRFLYCFLLYKLALIVSYKCFFPPFIWLVKRKFIGRWRITLFGFGMILRPSFVFPSKIELVVLLFDLLCSKRIHWGRDCIPRWGYDSGESRL